MPGNKKPGDVSASPGKKMEREFVTLMGLFRPTLSGFEILEVNIRLNTLQTSFRTTPSQISSAKSPGR
jgi:hypothetical protein